MTFVITFFSWITHFTIPFHIDNSMTIQGDNSYIEVTVNSQLVQLDDGGSLSFRTIDISAILVYGSWYLNDAVTGDYITIEIINGTIQLRTAISGSK